MSLFQLTSEDYTELMKQSISEYGNATRMKNAIEKAKTDKVTIGFLGGSITIGYALEGDIEENYRVLFYRYFSGRYCGTGNCSCINASFSSQNSTLGLAFAEAKLREAHPDIVFIEYGINNGIDKFNITSFESLVYKLLNFDSKPAVIPIIVCNKDLYTCSSYMEMIAKHYDLPTVNVYQVLKSGMESGLFAWSDYSGDYGHPSKDGHILIADCMKKLFETFEEKESCPGVIPARACMSRDYCSFQLLNHNSLTLEGCAFIPAETNEVFPFGWTYANGSRSSSQLSISCRALFAIYEISNTMDYGEVEIYEDDKLITRIDGYSIYGWVNPDIKLILHEKITANHILTIRMRKGDEKKKFNLLGFGVVK